MRWLHALALGLSLLGCGNDSPGGPPGDASDGGGPEEFVTVGDDTHDVRFAGAETDSLTAAEQAARSAYARATVTVRGRLLAPDGSPVAGAMVHVDGVSTVSLRDGRFELARLRRHNRALQIEAEGYRKTFLYPQLVAPPGVDTVDVPVIWLVPTDPAAVRFLFAGDLMLGRRFLDPDASTPRDTMPPPDPEALISTAAPEVASRTMVRFVKPLFREADFSVVNLETPITDDLSMPHLTKDFCFFTLPGSLTALDELGIDYAGLGNNHLYDYQQPGLSDTRSHLTAAGFPYSGAGATVAEAFAPYRTEINGGPYSFVAMSGVIGSEHAVEYVASASQGGAADLRDDATIAATLNGERAAGRAVIAMLHQGREYTYEPNAASKNRMAFVTAQGADLVIGHHPHVAHGFGYLNGDLQVHSLGNFAFDSERSETYWSMVVQLELEGRQVRDARAIPIYIEDFRPRPMTATSSDVFLRRIAEFSNAYGAFARADSNILRVTPSAAAWSESDETQTIEVEVDETGFAIVDLRGRVPSTASVRTVRFTGGRVRVGRDLLQFGDFEDADVDDDTLEAVRWDTGGSKTYPCLAKPYRGATALCLRADPTQTGASLSSLRERVRVMGDADDTPNKDLSMFGYVRHEHTGPVKVRADYLPSGAGTVIASQEVYASTGADHDWVAFKADMNMPADTPSTQARAIRLFLRHETSPAPEAMVMFDDLAIIAWEQEVGTTPLVTPHARDFLRVEAAPGKHTLVITTRSTRRAEAP